MRGPAPNPRASRAKRQRAIVARKRWPSWGAAYTIEPHPRTPEEVLESLFRAKREKRSKDTGKARPKPLYKPIRASRQHDAADTLAPAREEICYWLAKEYRQRNPSGTHPQILLMDGDGKIDPQRSGMNERMSGTQLGVLGEMGAKRVC